MNVPKFISSVCHLLFLLALTSSFCLADSINSAQSFASGTSLDLLDLEALGIDPSNFLFTQNTMYDFNGVYNLTIVAAPVDPGQTSSLDGLPLQIATIALGTSEDPSDVSSPIASNTSASPVPEPAALLLSTLAFGGLLWFAVGRFGQCAVEPEELIDG